MAVEAERAGFDGVMVSEHIVLGRGADADGLPENPRDYALPGNQDPATPWPSSLLLLAAIASVTTRLRLIASAVIPPLRHPLLIAKELATLDLLSQRPARRAAHRELASGRVRGARACRSRRAGRASTNTSPRGRCSGATSPAGFDGAHYAFDDVWLEPKPFRPDGPAALVRRPAPARPAAAAARRATATGSTRSAAPSDDDLERLAAAMAAAGRDLAELEMVGGTRGAFPDASHPAPLDEALDQIPEQVARGFRTICIKPSQFTDDRAEIPDLLRAHRRRRRGARALD